MIYPILKLYAHPLLDRKRATYTGDGVKSSCKMTDLSAGIKT